MGEEAGVSQERAGARQLDSGEGRKAAASPEPPSAPRLRLPDVNECLQLPRTCAYQCHNLQGSYRCLCPPGHTLLRDGKACTPLERSGQNVTTVSHRAPLASWLRPRVPTPSASDHAWASLRPGPGALSRGGRAWCPAGFIRQHGVCTGKVEPSTHPGHTPLCPLGSWACGLHTPCSETQSCRREGWGLRPDTGHFGALAVLTGVSVRVSGGLPQGSPGPAPSPAGRCVATCVSETRHVCLPASLRHRCLRPDLDECRVRNLCQHACRNTEGSYRCLCPAGYRLLPSGKNCQGELLPAAAGARAGLVGRGTPHPVRPLQPLLRHLMGGRDRDESEGLSEIPLPGEIRLTRSYPKLLDERRGAWAQSQRSEPARQPLPVVVVKFSNSQVSALSLTCSGLPARRPCRFLCWAVGTVPACLSPSLTLCHGVSECPLRRVEHPRRQGVGRSAHRPWALWVGGQPSSLPGSPSQL